MMLNTEVKFVTDLVEIDWTKDGVSQSKFSYYFGRPSFMESPTLKSYTEMMASKLSEQNPDSVIQTGWIVLVKNVHTMDVNLK